MSIWSILVGLLDPLPLDHWTVTIPSGASATVTKANVSMAVAASPLDLDFEFTTGDNANVSTTILKGTVAVDGTATISLDGVDQTDNPVIHAGLAVHWEPLPVIYVIVRWSFNLNGVSQLYDFQGKK